MRLKIQKQYTILDSNFLVALLDEKDKWNEKAKLISEELEEAQCIEVVLDCVVNEVISVLAKRFRERRDAEFREALGKLEKRIPKSKIVWAYPRVAEFYDAVLDLVKQYNGKLNFHDALILTVMTTAGLKYIVSFDEDFDFVEGIKRIDHESIKEL